MNDDEKNVPVPRIDGDWWTIAGNPNLGAYSRKDQQPLDFSIWQAADRTWQMVACCRGTGCGGKGRLFHRWQSDSLLSENWDPMGIFLEADPSFGETVGGLQAPNVIKHNDEYFMVYGDWVNICMATSRDGKEFTRRLGADGLSRLFADPTTSSTRDPHVMHHQNSFYLYYTGISGGRGRIHCRISEDLRNWGEPAVVNSGGSGGNGTSDAECPCVISMPTKKLFYLFRTHTSSNGYGYETSVYCSDDPLNFGIGNDALKVSTLQLEAVTLIEADGQSYVASLLPDLTGIMIAKMKWAQAEDGPSERRRVGA